MIGLLAVALLAGCGGGSVDDGATRGSTVTTDAGRAETGAVTTIDDVEAGTIDSGTVDTPTSSTGDSGEPATTTTVGAEPSPDTAPTGTETATEPVAPSISEAEVAALERDLDELDQLLTDIELELDQD